VVHQKIKTNPSAMHGARNIKVFGVDGRVVAQFAADAATSVQGLLNQVSSLQLCNGSYVMTGIDSEGRVVFSRNFAKR
jgi:hypothetical protein